MIRVVIQVCGYRLRLHFDGYSDCHDFWVNANSPDVHPAGWCESTGHKLHTPKGERSYDFGRTERPGGRIEDIKGRKPVESSGIAMTVWEMHSFMFTLENILTGASKTH